MNRRHFIGQGGLLGASLVAAPLAVLNGCASRLGSARSRHANAEADLSLPYSSCGLPPVRVAQDREIRTVVGLRPYRPSGFVVRAERLGDKIIVHNYGHGGGGITLSWGTSKLALDLGAPGHLGPVAVLGCGAVGLANARLLQEAGFAVTIYAKALPPETTSNIAGGQWFPFSVSEPSRRNAAFDEQLLAAATYAYRRYQTMVGPRFGVRWMRNYFLRNSDFLETGYLGEYSPLRGMMPEYRRLQPREHPFAGYPFVRQLDTMIVEPPVYLAAMLDEFLLATGKIVVREIADRAAILALPEKLVFNCTGLGAKALFDDAELIPVKGQLTVLLPQPEVQYAVGTENLYMFPRSDGILLGGTFEHDQWSLEPDPVAKQRILSGHQALFDAFRRC